MSPYSILVVSHTHWDREWYVPFEVLRFGLVRVMDQVIDNLERDSGLHTFLLDGQIILLEDYLSIRPEQASRLRALIQAGRLQIGPWYIQPDEFLVSAEALVRNLLKGFREGAQFGPVMKQGYIPDTFGHISQLPQILRGFGIDTFYFMRGLGADKEALRSEFWWEAPDGSRVLAHFLSQSYSNAAVLNADPSRMRLHHSRTVVYDTYPELIEKLGSVSSGSTLLLMNGGDHLLPQTDFGATLHALQANVSDELRSGTLVEFAQAIRAEGADKRLQTLRGELRFGRYHPVLKDVLSTRLYLKQANAAAESLLERQVERLVSLLRVGGDDRLTDFLPHLWAELLRNHPHDSICGCSIDEVHREMLTRFAHVQQLGSVLVADALQQLALAAAPQWAEYEIPVVVFNPSPWIRDGLVEVDVAPYLTVPLGDRVYDWEREARAVDVASCALVDDAGQELEMRIIGKHLVVADMLYRRKNIRYTRIEFAAEALSPMGFRVYRLRPSVTPVVAVSSLAISPAQAVEPTIANEHLQVTAHTDGTLDVTHLESGQTYTGLHVFLDEADIGDEYTFCPLEGDTLIESRATAWTVDADPAMNTLTLRGTFMLPARFDERRTTRGASLVACPIETTVRLAPRSRRVDLRTTIENTAADHRLRVAFASGYGQVSESNAETAYDVIARPTTPEPSEGWRERTSLTYAQQRFVTVESQGKGLAILSSGLPEYEVTADGRLLLTLIRAVGWLSREHLATRPDAAGPEIATPEAQCLGSHTYTYAILPYAGRWTDARLFHEAEAISVPLLAHAVQGERPDLRALRVITPFLTIEEPEIVLSALKPAEDNDGIIVRVFNPLAEPRAATLKFGAPPTGVQLTNLNEEVLPPDQQVFERTDSTVRIAMRPHQVRSIAIHWRRES